MKKKLFAPNFLPKFAIKTFFYLEAAGLFLLRFGKEFPFMSRSLTQGPVMKTMLLFALPLVLGDLLQQCYNIADTLVVSRAIGPDALAAVGSAFTLMTFLTSILLGLCLGPYHLYLHLEGVHVCHADRIDLNRFKAYILILDYSL